MGVKHRDGFIEASSSLLDSPSQLEGEYDVLVAASSWDQRCLCITHCRNVKAEHGIVVLFDHRDSLGLRDSHDAQLERFCDRACETKHVVRGSSVQVAEMWDSLSATLEQIRRKLQRPLRLLLDLSTCPRYYAAAILSEHFGGGLVEQVVVFYAEAKYPLKREISFTSGGWSPVPIPGLLGRFDPGKKRFYLVSVGWEGWKTLRVVGRADPDRVSVLFPEPGYKPGYTAKAREQNAELVTRYLIPDDQIILAPAGDAVAAWKALSDADLERPCSENVSYLLTGTKPHSVGLVLRALVLGAAEVLYIVPEEHVVLKTVPNGKFWKYDIRDVTALRSRG